MKSKFWLVPTVLMAGFVLMPIAVIVLSWADAQVDIWQHLIQTGLAKLLGNTFSLMLGVALGVTALGVSLAWLTAVCEFPGRRFFDWALVLPLAMPTYVVAFVALGFFSYGGVFLSQWRDWFGRDAWYPDIRDFWGVCCVFIFVLYPYVYLLSRTAFVQQGRELSDAAQTLGVGAFKAFFLVVLPVARPAIAAGVSLVLMETLADFGAVTVFNYDTFTTAIYKSWFGFFNLQAAAQLASLLLLFVALAVFVESKSRKRDQIASQVKRIQNRIILRGFHAYAATIFCFLVFVLSFVAPFVQLLVWLYETGFEQLSQAFFTLVYNTFILGFIAATAVLSIALLSSFGLRFFNYRWLSLLSNISTLGYALPGSVLAVGIMLVFTRLDRHILWPLFGKEGSGQILVGSVAALILAYLIRFFAVGFYPVKTTLDKLRPNMQDAAHSLGETTFGAIKRVYFPLLSPGIVTALFLTLIDVMKEMPATLLLRPFGWDTLAVRIYELTSEGEWERAALPAILLVAISLVPVIVMIKRSVR